MSDTVKRALDLVSQYQDAKTPKMKGFNWRPLKDVHEELEGLPEIPDYIHNYGDFMHEMAAKAATKGLSNRDLLKAYAITRASIHRGAISSDKVREKGMAVPDSPDGKIRPEGAMGEWLKTNMGQRYLDAAEDGRVDKEAVAHAQNVMSSFGNAEKTEGQGLPWAVQNLSGKHELVSHLVKLGMASGSPVKPWRDFATKLHGIKYAKSGFVGSLLGIGNQPTWDARQINLHTGVPADKEEKRLRTNAISRAGSDAVDRLADRQVAMNPRLDPSMEPFRQHLTHHAVWDKTEGTVTPHDDLMDAMRHANAGGRISKQGGGPMSDDERKHQMLIHAIAAMGGDHGLDEITHPELVKHLRSGSTQDIVRRALELSEKGGSYTRTGAGMLQRNPDLINTVPAMTQLKNTKKSGHLITPLSEMEAEFAPKHNLEPWKPFDVEKANREGATLVPMVGDNTPANTVLKSIMGVPTGNVNQQGGGDYPRSEFGEGDEKTGWRNRAGAAKTFMKRIKEYGKEGPVIGLHMAMGLGSADSSHMVLHSAINQINHLPIKKADIEKFDDEMRQKFPQNKDFPKPWPGIKDTQGVHDFFYNTGNPKKPYRPGTHVSKFMQNMDSVRWRTAGFPDVGAVRFANAHPDLLGTSQLSTGYSATEFDPNGKLVMNKEGRSHGTYEAGLPHKGYAGGFRAPVQAEKIWTTARSEMPEKIKGKPVDYQSPSGKTLFQQKLMTATPGQKMSNEIADTIQKAAESGMPFSRKTGGRVQPTDAQKEAGNYRKEHISFQGLPISVETSKGQTRSGTGPNGHKWSVKLPYDYGYIKRTEGADGDHVDVCIGPHHQSDRVFVVDQHDHRTGKFDEHKVMLGYRTKSEAEHAYMSGFSDGKGKDRMKTVASMSMEQFKLWLKRGNTKKPIERALNMTSLYSLGHDRDAG